MRISEYKWYIYLARSNRIIDFHPLFRIIAIQNQFLKDRPAKCPAIQANILRSSFRVGKTSDFNWRGKHRTIYLDTHLYHYVIYQLNHHSPMAPRTDILNEIVDQTVIDSRPSSRFKSHNSLILLNSQLECYHITSEIANSVYCWLWDLSSTLLDIELEYLEEKESDLNTMGHLRIMISSPERNTDEALTLEKTSESAWMHHGSIKL